MITRRQILLAASGAAATVYAPAAPAATDGRLPLHTSGGESAAFYYGDKWDKPFLYPIRSVSGLVLSRGYPMETIAGEQTDHAWHRGLWYGHGIINGQDFWRELGRAKTSTLVVKGEPKVRTAGRHRASVAADFAMKAPTGRILGAIQQEWAIEDRDKLRFIDATITIHASAGEALTFGDTDDGGFAFRLSDAFRQDRGAKLRNSSGLEKTENIWGKPAHWVDYATVVNGTPVGVAIFDHPSNLRYPTPWHARGYSLCAANPFATRSFSKGKGPDGSHTLAAGSKLQFRYRVLVHEGECEPDRIESLHREWAQAGGRK